MDGSRSRAHKARCLCIRGGNWQGGQLFRKLSTDALPTKMRFLLKLTENTNMLPKQRQSLHW